MIKLSDDCVGRATGCQHAKPRSGFKPRITTLGNSRYARQRTRGLGAANSQGPKLASLDLADHRRNGREHEIDPSSQQVIERLGPLVGNMLGLDTHALDEHEARQMRGRAHAGRSIIKGAVLGFAVGHEFGKCLDRQCRVDHQHVGNVGNQDDGHKLCQWVVFQVLEQSRIDGDRADRGDSEGVAVSGSTRHDFVAYVSTRTRFVFDDKGLPELFG